MSELRKKIIRLAYEQPKFREDLLPLLAKESDNQTKEAIDFMGLDPMTMLATIQGIPFDVKALFVRAVADGVKWAKPVVVAVLAVLYYLWQGVPVKESVRYALEKIRPYKEKLEKFLFPEDVVKIKQMTLKEKMDASNRIDPLMWETLKMGSTKKDVALRRYLLLSALEEAIIKWIKR